LQKMIDIDDEKKLHMFYDKRMGQEVTGDQLGEQYKGYVFRISGGNDKQGFPMMQGVLLPTRVRLLLGDGAPCFRERTKGSKKRKSVRGCIVGPDLAVLNLVIVQKGGAELPGLTDGVAARRLGPKRANKIRKLFELDKKADVRKFVIRREIVKENGKKVSRAPKIQRLITPRVLEHKRHRIALKKQRYTKQKADAANYAKLLKQRLAEQKSKRTASVSKRRTASSKKATATAPAGADAAKAVATPAAAAAGKPSAAVGGKPAGAAKPAGATAKPPVAAGAAKPAAAAAAPAKAAKAAPAKSAAAAPKGPAKGGKK